MVEDEELRTLGQRLCEVDGVVAVLLGGSRARGEHAPESDFDLGLYYRSPLDIAGRTVRLAVASAGRLPEAPAGFAKRAQGVLAHLGTTPDEG